MVTAWEPGRNAVHGLLQIVDVLAIALNRFHQLSFRLPHPTNQAFSAERERLWHDYSEIKHAIFPRADIAPQHTAARIAHLAVAELARAGSRDETAVGAAQQWMTAMGWILVPHPAPKGVDPEQWRPYENEATILSQHEAVRQGLFAALARVGQAVPDEVVQRMKLAVCPLVHDGEEPVPQSLLLGWVREAAMSSEASSSRGTPPQFPPTVAQHLERWRADTARYASEARAHVTAFEAAREAFEVWQRVAYFSGREADTNGRKATDEEVSACYVNLLLELGRTLSAVGYDGRVQALDPGTEGTRVMAVELLRLALAGDREAVAHLDSAMRDALFVGGGAAAAYLKNELRYEVLGMRPPVPVPPGWEGPRPDNETRTLPEFLAWVDHQLEVNALFFGRRDDRNTGCDVRNAHRLLAHLNVTHEFPFPHGPMTNGEEEAHFRNLRSVCLGSQANRTHPASGDTDECEAPLDPLPNATLPASSITDGSDDAEPPPVPNEPDGPFGTDGFRLGGVEVEFGKAEDEYKLVQALWDTRAVKPTEPQEAENVIEAVWGEGNSTSDEAFRQLCHRARKRLESKACTFTIKTVRRGIVAIVPC